jgi:hypothetical protein
MSLFSVNSSAIAAIGHEDGALAVLFTASGPVYIHPGVPPSVHAGLMQAQSMGAFYNRHIRGRYW